MRDIMIEKGMRIKVNFNSHGFSGPLPDIKEVFVTSDDGPRLLSTCKTLGVGKTMKIHHSITPDQVVLSGMQCSLFQGEKYYERD